MEGSKGGIEERKVWKEGPQRTGVNGRKDDIGGRKGRSWMKPSNPRKGLFVTRRRDLVWNAQC